MANTLTNIMPKILAKGLLALRERCILPGLVNMDYGSEAAQKGTTIDVPISTAISVAQVSPSNVLPAPGDTTPDLVQISLDKWYKNTPFHLTDKELTEVDRNRDFIPMQVSEAVRGIANQVNQDIFSTYTDVGNAANTAGSALDVDAIVEARKRLNISNAPNQDRAFVINHAAEADLLGETAFSQWNAAGPSSTENIQIRGEIGERFGFRWFADDDCPLHTSGTAADDATLLTNGATAVGARTVSMTYNAVKTLKAGDSFTIDGDSTMYSVAADVSLASGNTDVTFSPALKVAAANDTDIVFFAPGNGTIGVDRRIALAFHRDAFALATRPLMASASDLAMGSNMMSMTDPQTGLSLRLEVQRQYKQTTWEFDILYGVKCVRPEYACKVYSATS